MLTKGIVRRLAPFVYLAACLLSLYGCGVVTKKYESPRVSTEQLYRVDSLSRDTLSMGELSWREMFTDTLLHRLVEEGISRNLDLKVAIQRIEQSHATLRQKNAAFWPSLDAAAQLNPSVQSRAAINLPPQVNINLNTINYRLALSSSWEIDVWGKMASAKRSALASYLSTASAKRAVQTQLVSDIVNSYYRLLALDEQLKITKQTLAYRTADVETMKALKEAAAANGAAVAQSEANRYAAEVSLPDIRQAIMEEENLLSLLLARPSGPIARGALTEQAAPKYMKTGAPALLLQNRPDVQQAEFAFRASFEQTNMARTYFYPALTITASVGLSSLTLNNFFTNSLFYNALAGLLQPIFNRGENRARLAIAKAQQEEALYLFQKTLLTAGQEVSNALARYSNVRAKQESRSLQLAALEKALTDTRELLQYSSSTNYTDVLTSEQSLLAARLSSVNDRLQELLAGVELYRALGGGVR